MFAYKSVGGVLHWDAMVKENSCLGGDMYFLMNRGDIKEVFRIKSESIDFYGALLTEEKGDKYYGRGLV
jgi:hypothetical protein